jgi:DNA-binding CsgD family transcriptional regulator
MEGWPVPAWKVEPGRSRLESFETLPNWSGLEGLAVGCRFAAGSTCDLPDSEWQDAKPTDIRDGQVLAHTIHAKAMTIATGSAPDYKAKLTPRERECLTWSAVGKTSEDVATILGISEGVVRIHLQSAQHKLNCLNRTHTVAKALAHKLIFPDLR